MPSSLVLSALEAVRRRNGYAVPRTGRLVHRAAARLLPDEADVELLPGITVALDLRQPVELQSWWQGPRYEQRTTAALAAWAADATAFFDVGANYGFFALRALAAGCPEVHAFEPHPRLHARLERTRERNGLTGLRCHHLGLGDRAGTLELAVKGTDLGHSSFGPRHWPDAERVAVPVQTFDAWRTSAGLALPAAPTWVAKVDVEGYELLVLRGMEEALAERAFRALVVELNEPALRAGGTSVDEVVALLAAAGYREEGAPAASAVRNGHFVPVPAPSPARGARS